MGKGDALTTILYADHCIDKKLCRVAPRVADPDPNPEKKPGSVAGPTLKKKAGSGSKPSENKNYFLFSIVF